MSNADKKKFAEQLLAVFIPSGMQGIPKISDANVANFKFDADKEYRMEFDICQMSNQDKIDAEAAFKKKFGDILNEQLDSAVAADIVIDVAFHHYDGATCARRRRRRRSLLDDSEDVTMIVDASVPVNKATATPYSDDTLYERTWANANAIANYVHFVFHGDQAMAEASKYITEHAAVADHKLFHKA